MFLFLNSLIILRVFCIIYTREQKIWEKMKTFTKETTTDRPLSLYAAGFSLTMDDIKGLSGKTLLLVGGGKSPIKHELKKLGIDCKVVNIDPYTEGHDKKNADVLIENNFFNTEFKDKFDEVWALYSLPAYAESNEQELLFYTKAVAALAPNGVLRVAGFGHKRDEVGIDYKTIPGVPPLEKFNDEFNAKFPDNKIETRKDVYVLNIDSSNVKRNPPSLSEYFAMEKEAKIKSEQKAKEKTAETGTARLLEKHNTHIIFRAPEDKKEMNSWLENYTRNLPSHRSSRSLKTTKKNSR